MNNFLKIAFLGLVSSTSSWAFLYGDMDYVHAIEYKGTPLYEVSKSVGAFFTDNLLKYDEESGTYILSSKKLKERNLSHGEGKSFLHPDEPMANDQAQATCTFSLVAKNLVLTAGHCIMSKDVNFRPTAEQFKNPQNIDCSKTKFQFAFNYREDRVNEDGTMNFDKKDVYTCKSVKSFGIDWAIMPKNTPDYALIELDREVEDRVPLKLAHNTVEVGTNIATIGHPSSTTQKINSEGLIMHNRRGDKNVYFAEIDGLPAISGAPVFNLENGEIIGVFIRAGQPFYLNMRRGSHQRDEEFLFFHGVPKMGVNQSKNPSQVLKSTYLSHIFDLVNQDNIYHDQFANYTQSRESLKVIAKESNSIVDELARTALNELRSESNNEQMQSRRNISQRLGKINSQISKPFSWSTGFIKGLIRKDNETELEVRAISALLSQSEHLNNILDVLSESDNEKEFNEKLESYIDEAIIPYLTEELVKISMLLPDDKVLSNSRAFRSWLKDCSQCEEFVQVTKITQQSFYQELKRRSLEFDSQESAYKNLRELLVIESKKSILGTSLIGFASTSLATIYALPVVAVQATTTVNHVRCINKRYQARVNWLNEVQEVKTHNLEAYNELMAQDEVKAVYEDILDNKRYCTQLVLEAYLQTNASKQKGKNSARNFKSWTNRVFSKKQ